MLFTVCSFSQEKGDLRIGAFSNIAYYDNALLPQYGVCGDLFIADNISLKYSYGFGVNSDGELTAHINPSLFLVPFGLYYPPSIIFILLVSEGIAYHVPINEHIEFAPYISPLGAEINLEDDSDIVLSGNAGASIYFKHFSPISNLFLAFSGGATVIYKDVTTLPSLRVSLMYNF